MATKQATETHWEAEPVYIGDDVYQCTDVVTDVDDFEGNPVCVVIQTGSAPLDREVARRIVKARDGYMACGEAVLAMEKARAWVKPYMAIPGHDAAAGCIDLVLQKAIDAAREAMTD